jgi:hypothetical protein
MAETSFKPKLSGEEAEVLCDRYDYEKDFWFEIAGRSILEGDFSRRHFDTIFEWKTGNRGKSRPAKNNDKSIARALKLVVEERDNPIRPIDALTQLSGVGVPVASAIMTAVFPGRFTVIDFRALSALSVEGYSTSSSEKYLEYVEYCIALARNWGVTLRDLDRALWKWSEKHDAKLLCTRNG